MDLENPLKIKEPLLKDGVTKMQHESRSSNLMESGLQDQKEEFLRRSKLGEKSLTENSMNDVDQIYLDDDVKLLLKYQDNTLDSFERINKTNNQVISEESSKCISRKSSCKRSLTEVPLSDSHSRAGLGFLCEDPGLGSTSVRPIELKKSYSDSSEPKLNMNPGGGCDLGNMKGSMGDTESDPNIMDAPTRCKASTNLLHDDVDESNLAIFPRLSEFSILSENESLEDVANRYTFKSSYELFENFNLMTNSEKLTMIEKYLCQRVPCDFKLSCMVASFNMRSSKLVPYPVMFSHTADGHEQIVQANQLIPSVDLISYYFTAKETSSLSTEVIDLLYWNFVVLNDPRLIEVSSENHLKVLQKVNSQEAFLMPDHVLKLMYRENSPIEVDWASLEKDKQTKFAFFPVRVECIYTLLQYGVLPGMTCFKLADSKNTALSNSLKECLERGKACWTWGKSRVGFQVKVVALVEFVHSSQVLSFPRDHGSGETSSFEVKHYIVPYPEVARVRYLLVYVTVPSSLLPIEQPKQRLSALRPELSRTWQPSATSAVLTILAITFGSALARRFNWLEN